jgi:hypothetical protein
MKLTGMTIAVEASFGVDHLLREIISEQRPRSTDFTLAAFMRGTMNVIGEPACP